MRKFILTLAVLAGVATSLSVPAKADCRWEWNGNGWQQICRSIAVHTASLAGAVWAAILVPSIGIRDLIFLGLHGMIF